MSLRHMLPFVLILMARQGPALDPRLAGVNDWLYILQPGAVGIEAIAASGFDGAVMDYSGDGSGATEYTPAQIASLKAAGMLVLAYLSIGEAEDYRYYWDPAWNDQPRPDPDAPPWLGPFNPQFPNNYKVRYWEPSWQAILFGTPSGPDKSYLDRIIDQGFDGVYLDIVDAFEYWSDTRPERTRFQARTDMANLVAAIRNHARVTRGVSDFLVFPQNAPAMLYDDSEQVDALALAYLGAIDGIGAEDTFYNEFTPQNQESVDYVTTLLELYRTGGGEERMVLAVDYVWNESRPDGEANKARYNDFKSKALARGYVPYAAVSNRDLDEILIVSPGNGLAPPQPREDIPSGALDTEDLLRMLQDVANGSVGPSGLFEFAERWRGSGGMAG
ncbi:MAG: endo alpha-1,4 polygalactosaminidase, partial [Candidatus Omnitrophica bacterium]|nr:endo alpha-1,4 polygalactosaminidase [Candidatus Omnitrophota bacterium]